MMAMLNRGSKSANICRYHDNTHRDISLSHYRDVGLATSVERSACTQGLSRRRPRRRGGSGWAPARRGLRGEETAEGTPTASVANGQPRGEDVKRGGDPQDTIGRGTGTCPTGKTLYR